MLEDFTNGQIKDHKQLVLYCDGACEPKNPGGVATAGWALFLLPEPSADEQSLAEEYQVVRDGRNNSDPRATNNFAEYCALGRALRFLADNQWRGSLRVFTDSKLMTNQVSTKWKCNKKHLQELRARIWELLEQLELTNVNRDLLDGLDDEGMTTEYPQPGEFYIKWIPRDENEYADELSKRAYVEYTGQHPMERRQKKKPPPRKFRPGEQLVHCTGCGFRGTMADVGVEDGNLNCPRCQTASIVF